MITKKDATQACQDALPDTPARFALHLDAGRDQNGNPRRLFLVIDAGSGSVVEAVDEEFYGFRALPDTCQNVLPRRIKIPAAEYRALLREFQK